MSRATFADVLDELYRVFSVYERPLCAIAQADPHIDWYLDAWDADTSAAARRNLVRLLAENPEASDGQLDSAWWSGDGTPIASNYETARAWLRRAATGPRPDYAR
jgi:hypothetical protein